MSETEPTKPTKPEKGESRVKVNLPGAADAHLFTSKGRVKNGNIVDLPDDEIAALGECVFPADGEPDEVADFIREEPAAEQEG